MVNDLRSVLFVDLVRAGVAEIDRLLPGTPTGVQTMGGDVLSPREAVFVHRFVRHRFSWSKRGWAWWRDRQDVQTEADKYPYSALNPVARRTDALRGILDFAEEIQELAGEVLPKGCVCRESVPTGNPTTDWPIAGCPSWPTGAFPSPSAKAMSVW